VEKEPLVSVIIPTYNRGGKITETIDALEELDYSKNKLEIIIVNDCSTDSTEYVISSISRKKRNLKFLKTKINSGPAAARNVGIKNAGGKYLFFIDDDCIVPKEIIKEYVNFLENNPNVAGVGGGLEPSSDNIFSKIEKFKNRLLGLGMDSIKIGRNIKVGFTGNMMYKREIVVEEGLFDEKYKVPAGEDVALKERICKNYDVAYLPIKVIHNDDYNLNYVLAALWKQGLDRSPPKNLSDKLIKIIPLFPFLIYNVLRKLIIYRSN
jgi:glycosyltransferase involved in cell wall biosynthesis